MTRRLGHSSEKKGWQFKEKGAHSYSCKEVKKTNKQKLIKKFRPYLERERNSNKKIETK
jgi:hypothetical protein